MMTPSPICKCRRALPFILVFFDVHTNQILTVISWVKGRSVYSIVKSTEKNSTSYLWLHSFVPSGHPPSSSKGHSLEQCFIVERMLKRKIVFNQDIYLLSFQEPIVWLVSFSHEDGKADNDNKEQKHVGMHKVELLKAEPRAIY